MKDWLAIIVKGYPTRDALPAGNDPDEWGKLYTDKFKAWLDITLKFLRENL